MNANSYEQYLEEDEIDLRQLFLKLWGRRYLIFFCMIISGAAFTVLAFLMTPTYRATATLIAAGAEKNATGVMEGALGQLGGVASLAEGFGAATVDPVTAEALAVLQSRQFTEQFIRDKGLMQKIYRSRWDSLNKKWKPSLFNKEPTITKAYEYFNKNISTVSMDKKTTLITLQIDWKDRNEGAQWANELVQRLNAEMRTRAIEKSKKSINYLKTELSSTNFVGTQESINRLIETQVKLQMLANVTEEYSFRIIDMALPADVDEPIKPKKLLMALFGAFVGVFFGVILTLVPGLSPRPNNKQE